MPFEVIAGSLAATAAVPTQIVMFGNDSRVIRNFDLSKKCFITDWRVTGPVLAGMSIIKSAKMHDNVLGIHSQLSILGSQGLPKFPLQQVYPQDNLDLLMVDTLGAGEWDNFIVQLWYEDLPASNGKFVNADYLKGKVKNIITVNINDTPAGASGYQTEHNLAFVSDLMRANTEYALIGFNQQGDQEATGIRGPMTGNLRIAMLGPASNTTDNYSFFVDKSINSGIPCIPVLNSADRYATFVDFLENIAGTDNNIDLYFAELG